MIFFTEICGRYRPLPIFIPFGSRTIYISQIGNNCKILHTIIHFVTSALCLLFNQKLEAYYLPLLKYGFIIVI